MIPFFYLHKSKYGMPRKINFIALNLAAGRTCRCVDYTCNWQVASHRHTSVSQKVCKNAKSTRRPLLPSTASGKATRVATFQTAPRCDLAPLHLSINLCEVSWIASAPDGRCLPRPAYPAETAQPAPPSMCSQVLSPVDFHPSMNTITSPWLHSQYGNAIQICFTLHYKCYFSDKDHTIYKMLNHHWQHNLTIKLTSRIQVWLPINLCTTHIRSCTPAQKLELLYS